MEIQPLLQRYTTTEITSVRKRTSTFLNTGYGVPADADRRDEEGMLWLNCRALHGSSSLQYSQAPDSLEPTDTATLSTSRATIARDRPPMLHSDLQAGHTQATEAATQSRDTENAI